MSRSFAVDVAALTLVAAIIIILLALPGYVRAEPRSTIYRNSLGQEVGRAEQRGNSTIYFDALGRQNGRADRK